MNYKIIKLDYGTYMTSDGFFKMEQGRYSYDMDIDIFYNPNKDIMEPRITRNIDDDIDYTDVRNMPYCKDEQVIAYYQKYLNKSKHDAGIFMPGDFVKIIKGRKLHIGDIKQVKGFYSFKDKFGRPQSSYVTFTDGTKTNENNCILYKGILD